MWSGNVGIQSHEKRERKAITRFKDFENGNFNVHRKLGLLKKTCKKGNNFLWGNLITFYQGFD